MDVACRKVLALYVHKWKSYEHGVDVSSAGVSPAVSRFDIMQKEPALPLSGQRGTRALPEPFDGVFE
jgi:hypothetical protein